MPSSDARTECNVCLVEGLTPADTATMPCCDSTGAYRMCRECCVAIVPPAPGVGRCPFCREHVRRVEAPGSRDDVRVVGDAGTCLMCNQPRVLVGRHPRAPANTPPHLCHRCDLGLRLPALRYRCDECRAVQVIAHPMFLYQRTPQDVTDDTWACARCQDQRRFRLLLEDIPRVPPEELPDGWGARDDVIRRAREMVLRGRHGDDGKPLSGAAWVWRNFGTVAIGVVVLIAAANELGWLPSSARRRE